MPSRIDLLVIIIGLFLTAVLYHRFRVLPDHPARDGASYPKVSVIVPVRNEESNLARLLTDLDSQTAKPSEVICVDDSSEDATTEVAIQWGALLVKPDEKPQGWIGKSWACQNGADMATGDVLVFLDADVRMRENALRSLVDAYLQDRCTISVQPYHVTGACYEQVSLFFNLIEVAANGATLPRECGVGLFGPVILITRQDYATIGGHRAVRACVAEDVALGRNLARAGLKFRLFVGDHDFSFRMYPQGARSMMQGWIKNMATGATLTSAPLFVMVFLWITSMTSVALHMAKCAVSWNLPGFALCSCLYFAWALSLYLVGRHVGRFRILTYLLYPLPLAAALGVFGVSVFRKALHLGVTWKGREITPGGRSCE